MENILESWQSGTLGSDAHPGNLSLTFHYFLFYTINKRGEQKTSHRLDCEILKTKQH